MDKYCDDTFFSALEKWYYTKTWGMANGGVGWGNEPLGYMEAITILENEKNTMEHEEIEKRAKEMESKSKPKSKGR